MQLDASADLGAPLGNRPGLRSALVVVHRVGEFKVPVELEVEFADDTTERMLWDGQGRYEIFTWPGRRLRSARLDPDSKLLLEAHRLDNHRAAAACRTLSGPSPPATNTRRSAAILATSPKDHARPVPP